jgi:hypothetical protein
MLYLMNKFITHLIPICMGILISSATYGQAVGSSNTENSSRYIGTSRTSLAETLYIGPDAVITVEGTWHIYSKYIWISPLAQISGSGTIIFYNSDDVDGAGGSTIIDGNDNITLDVNIVHNNPAGMAINNVALSPSLVSDGWADNLTTSTLKIGKDFDMYVDGADVWLDNTPGVTGDFVFDQDATLSNYRASRMVITNNSIQSHMVKENAATGFIFPVGIADGDYSPAQVTGAGTYHVSVQNYAISASNEDLLQGGPERTWHIYADAATTATVALQHVVANEVTVFNSASPHFVTQYSGSAWSVSVEESGLPATLTTGSSPELGSSVQDLSGLSIPSSSSASTAYFTKATIRSLPVTLVSFIAKREGKTAQFTWNTASESDADRFEIERSIDALAWQTISSKLAIGNSKTPQTYGATDSQPQKGINYYRLKMIDQDGSFTYSRIQSLDFNNAVLKLNFYPNPVADYLFVKDSDGNPLVPESLKELTMTYTNGMVVYKSNDPGALATQGIDVRQFTPGIYLVKMLGSDGSITVQKIIINP